MTGGHMVIDGSYGEGGGQVLRTALALSAVSRTPVEIVNIRGKRAKPGLQPQHLASVRAAAAICGARLEGAAIGSTRLMFDPQTEVTAGRYQFDIGTAGSVGLVAATVLLPLALTDGVSQVTITGGTHVDHAPPADYVESVYQPALSLAGVICMLGYSAAGFFPKGGGRLHASITGGTPLRPVTLVERGKLLSLTAHVVTSGLPDHVADRGVAAVERYFQGVGRDVAVERHEPESPGAGAAVVLIAWCEGGMAGFTGLGRIGKPMERVAEEPCRAFMEWWKTGAAVDEHLADQLVLPAVLADGESAWTTPNVTEHLRTVLWVAQQFVPVSYRFDLQGEGGTLVTVSR